MKKFLLAAVLILITISANAQFTMKPGWTKGYEKGKYAVTYMGNNDFVVSYPNGDHIIVVLKPLENYWPGVVKQTVSELQPFYYQGTLTWDFSLPDKGETLIIYDSKLNPVTEELDEATLPGDYGSKKLYKWYNWEKILKLYLAARPLTDAANYDNATQFWSYNGRDVVVEDGAYKYKDYDVRDDN